MITSKMFF